MDDCLSVRVLEDRRTEIGVHIADVSFFVPQVRFPFVAMPALCHKSEKVLVSREIKHKQVKITYKLMPAVFKTLAECRFINIKLLF